MKYKEIQGESNIEKRLQLQYLTKLGKISDKIFSLMKNGATTTDDGDTLYTLRQQWTTTQSDISQLFQGKSIGTLQTQENTIEKMLLLQNFIEELKRLKSNLEDEIK